MVFRTSAGEEQAEHVAASLGWPCRGEIPADPRLGVPYEVQWAAGPALTLHYLEDELSASGCLTVSGEAREYAEAAASIAESLVDCFTVDELVTAVNDAVAPADRCRALLRTGLGAPREFAMPVYRTVAAGLRHDRPSVRESAVVATGYVPWPQYRPLLRRAAADPDARVRTAAGEMLAAFPST